MNEICSFILPFPFFLRAKWGRNRKKTVKKGVHSFAPKNAKGNLIHSHSFSLLKFQQAFKPIFGRENKRSSPFFGENKRSKL